MARRPRARLVRALLAALVSAGVIAALGVAAVALARQAAASAAGSAGRTALTGPNPSPTVTASVGPSMPSLSVNAGPDQTVTGTTVIQLAGSVSDPAATTSWSLVTGPPATALVPAGSATFGGTSPTTTATVTEAGGYVLRLTAVDGSQAASATVTITFNPGLPAGTFIGLLYPSTESARNQKCTTGFGVAQGSVDYELGAKHCIDGDIGNQNSNSEIQYFQPMTIQQLLSQNPLILGTVYADSIDCLPSAADCLLPSYIPQVIGDMVAWKPNTGVAVASLVQTGQGLLPVVGEKTLNQVAGTPVCHYGVGSLLTYGSAEQCADAPGSFRELVSCIIFRCELDESVILSLSGAPGDSGGPLYSYDYENGKPVGVFAIGIVIKANEGATGFIPIQNVESRLGVTLLTQAPLS